LFENAAQAAARFAGDEPGNIYSRFTNPTTQAFERRLAAMEGGEACVATASGMAAIMSLCLALLESGDHIVSSRSVFGTTTTLFDKYLPRFGIHTSFVGMKDLDDWKQAIRSNTRLLFLETPSNPLTEIADIKVLADLAHENNCLLVVDNCFCTPALQRPLDFGADLVVHSATKYLDGQGRIVGGAVVGPEQLVAEEIFGVIRATGPSLSPFNAWVALKGLETLSLRMKAHSQQALHLARFLADHPAVEQVYYPGLESHPHRCHQNVVDYRQSWRREDHDHTSCDDHAWPRQRRAKAAGWDRRGADSSRGGTRRSRRYHQRPRARARWLISIASSKPQFWSPISAENAS
jgi:O-succinylhomoserine sulfhydrylase